MRDYGGATKRRDSRRARGNAGADMRAIWGGAVAAAVIAGVGAIGAWGGAAAAQSVNGENVRPQPAGAAGNALAARQAQAAAQAKMAAHGEELFGQRCKSCHMPPVEHAPSRAELAAQFPNVIIDALKTGKMQAMASGLSDDDIASIAVFITGQAPDAHFDLTGESKNAC